MSLTREEIEQNAIDTVREIAAIASVHMGDENPGATQIAIIITAYSTHIAELLHTGFITLEEALRCTSADLDVIQAKLREVDALPRAQGIEL